MELKNFEKINILGTPISVLDCKNTCEALNFLAQNSKQNNKAYYVCVSNVHTVVEALDNEDLKIANQNAILATADGVPLIWASKFLKGPKIQGRASGPDILKMIIEDLRYSHLSHYFYGSTPLVLEKLIEEVKKLNPKIKIAGFFSPPLRKAKKIFEPLDSEELKELEMINKASPDLIWVGLGAPKQEITMYRYCSKLNSGVMIGVGAAFDFLSGNKKRAPLFMQKMGLEWLFRLMSEPRRLFFRYFKTNPRFVFEVLKEVLKIKFFSVF
jgi:N-acetylglucosaminyldiphosphoundecaprenol N-acetyl-beta-D-mannosaminyltransferase